MPIHRSSSTRSRLIMSVIALGICRLLLSANSKGRSVEGTQSDKMDIEAIKAKGLRVLIVDDEDRFRKSMANYLRSQFKTQVKSVDSGRAAIQEFEKGISYDVVFLDLMMDDLSGVQTYRELIGRNVKSRIVFMSAHSKSAEWDEAEGLGISPLGKPISDEDFMRIFSEA
jgi:CheY-like chemotaxis protein